jgi:hypothetical protein
MDNALVGLGLDLLLNSTVYSLVRTATTYYSSSAGNLLLTVCYSFKQSHYLPESGEDDNYKVFGWM